MKTKLAFSGHETFHCRHFWLKKGYDFVQNMFKFTDPDAVVKLGVGKNMVTSIRFWMRAFGLLDDDDKLSDFAHYLFGEDGKDPYLENYGTLWLLQYSLTKSNRASIYPLFFNEFRRERTEFNKTHFEIFLTRKCNEMNLKVSPNSIKKDIEVFIKNYMRPRSKASNIEDDLSAILIDLNLIQELAVSESGGTSWYAIESRERNEIPKEIILFGILDNHNYQNSVSFRNLLNDYNSVGCIFSLNSNGLIKKINEISEEFSDVIFTDDAGIKEVQFKKQINKWDVLNGYYAN